MTESIKLTPVQESMMGRKYTTNTGSVLTVVDTKILPMINTKAKRNKTWYYVICSVCHEDKELWARPIKTTKDHLDRDIIPCGCPLRPSYNEDQNKTRVKRRCKELSYEFIKWGNKYTTIHKTKVDVVDHDTHTNHTFSSIVVLMNSKGLSRERQNVQLRNRDCGSNIEDVQCSIDANHKYLMGTKVIGKNPQRMSYWYISCPSCSQDEYVVNNLCTGIFTIWKGDIDKGILPCRCSHAYRWKEEQRVYQINSIMGDIGGKFLGWVDGSYSKRSSRFNWECNRKHIGNKDVMTFLQGSRCPLCSKEDSNYGYYPKRAKEEDNLYLIRMSNDKEFFYKVGRSFDVVKRVATLSKTYNCCVINTLVDTHDRIYMLEQCIHRLIKEHHHTPLLYFKGGKTECFTKEIMGVKEIISTFNL